MQSFNKLPPLKSPRNPSFGSIEVDQGMAHKKIIANQRAKSKRTSLQPPSSNVNFAFATKKVPKMNMQMLNTQKSGGQIEASEIEITS